LTGALAGDDGGDDEAAGAALDEVRGRLGELQAHFKRLVVTANQLALLADEAAIESARATESETQAEADYLTTVEALVEALEARCPNRLGHGRRVAGLAVALGRRLRLSQAELAALYRAGLLADIGLSTVEADLLNSLGELDAGERLAIQDHPAASLRLLRGIGLLAGALPAIASHHERYDGGGYPDGLAGAAIPLGGRILAVADAVVAMLSPRPHRAALPPADMEAELIAGSGAQFDPAVVDAARALAAEGSLARLAGARAAGVCR
jgi:HD-GYP domain-containing protein (c-di-GMP phosphodiesterase class II)